jgi:hypothetical protein
MRAVERLEEDIAAAVTFTVVDHRDAVTEDLDHAAGALQKTRDRLSLMAMWPPER